MNIPDAAIEAAAEGIGHDSDCEESRTPSGLCNCGSVGTARAALSAAMPTIREAIAQEIEADITEPTSLIGVGQQSAARIVRGGTP